MSSSEEAWSEVAEHLRTLGSVVMDRAGDGAEDEGSAESVPSNDEFKEAVRVIGERAGAAFGSLTESIRDPEVRAEAEETTSAFLRAVGVSFSELGSQLSNLASGVQATEEPADE